MTSVYCLKIIDLKNPKYSTEKPINQLNKVAGYKNNTQKPTTFLYHNSNYLENKMKNLF